MSIYAVTWTEIGERMSAMIFESLRTAVHFADWRNEMAFASEKATVWIIPMADPDIDLIAGRGYD